MATRQRMPASVTLRFTVPCGQSKHGVEIRATAWGCVEVTTPCELLSPAVRRLSRSSCAELVSEQRRAVEASLQTVWCDGTTAGKSCRLPAAVQRRLDGFVEIVRSRKEALAEHLLTPPRVRKRPASRGTSAESAAGLPQPPAPGAGEAVGREGSGVPAATVSSRLPPGDESSADARCWAALVLAGRDPERAKALLSGERRWPSGILVAALCAHDWGDDPVGVSLLEQALQDPQIIPELRARFVAQLGEIGDERHAAVFVDAVCQRQPKVRSGAIRGLNRLFQRFRLQGQAGRERCAQTLTATLARAEEKYAQGEQQIVTWLSDWSRPRLELLAEAVLVGGPSSRIFAARLLQQSGDVRAADALSRAVCDRDPDVRQAATEGLVVLGPALVQAGESAVPLLAKVLQGESERLTLFALQTLRKIGSPRGMDAVLGLLRAATGAATKMAAIEALGDVGDERAAEPLLQSLGDRADDLSQAAARALTILMDRRGARNFVPLLAKALPGGSERLTLFALQALGKIGSPLGIDAVLGALRTACGAATKIAAIAALGSIGDERAAEPLLQNLGDSAGDVSQAAARALTSVIGRLGAPESSLALLGRSLRSGCPAVASAGLQRLTELGTPEAVRLIADSLPRLEQALQVQALIALRELDHSKTLVPVLDLLADSASPQEAEVTQQAVLTASSLVRKLSGVSSAGLAVLVRALECPHVQVAREAAHVLEACSDKRLAGRLLKACLRGDPQLSLAAGRGLKRLATAAQLTWLAEILWHGDDCMARGAEAALSAVGQRAVEPLLKAANWPFWRARRSALRALGRIGDVRASAVLRHALQDPDRRVREVAAAVLAGGSWQRA